MAPPDHDVDQDIRDLFGADPEAIDRVIARAWVTPPRHRLGRGLSFLTVAIVVGCAAVALWMRAPASPAGEESRLFYVGDLAVVVDTDGSSWVVGPGPAFPHINHIDLIIVEEKQP